MRSYVYTVLTLSILCTACSTSGVSVYTAMGNSAYNYSCTGSNSRNRPGDDECKYWGEPQPQPGAIRPVVVAKPDDFQMSWKCRREDMKLDAECQAWKSGRPVLIPKY